MACMEVSPGAYDYFKLYLSEKSVDVEAALPARSGADSTKGRALSWLAT